MHPAVISSWLVCFFQKKALPGLDSAFRRRLNWPSKSICIRFFRTEWTTTVQFLISKQQIPGPLTDLFINIRASKLQTHPYIKATWRFRPVPLLYFCKRSLPRLLHSTAGNKARQVINAISFVLKKRGRLRNGAAERGFEIQSREHRSTGKKRCGRETTSKEFHFLEPDFLRSSTVIR